MMTKHMEDGDEFEGDQINWVDMFAGHQGM